MRGHCFVITSFRGAQGAQMVCATIIHSAAKPQPKLASAAKAASRRSRYGRPEARPSKGVEILRVVRRMWGLVVLKWHQWRWNFGSWETLFEIQCGGQLFEAMDNEIGLKFPWVEHFLGITLHPGSSQAAGLRADHVEWIA
jgi:hypothetical protein